MPQFSWDTLPVFTHLASPTPYSQAQLAMLARFPLITIEKYMGPFPFVGAGASAKAEEDNIGAVAAAIKKINPRAKVLMYLNSVSGTYSGAGPYSTKAIQTLVDARFSLTARACA